MIIQITLLIAAQRDIRQRSENEINGNKWIWSAAALVNFVGPIAYFLFGRKK
ncbi:MAG: PLDc N-terminal domain-containing protein [Ardenticatenaceae bacterium]